MTTPVLLDVADGIAKVTLNRPDKGNALDQPMADALLDAALAAQLSEGAVGAMGQARKLLHDSFNSGFASQMDRKLSSVTAAGNGPEGREGINAFLTKRKPDFQGGG
jgi:enoyl-CoA hydratase/carnithine racemase